MKRFKEHFFFELFESINFRGSRIHATSFHSSFLIAATLLLFAIQIFLLRVELCQIYFFPFSSTFARVIKIYRPISREKKLIRAPKETNVYRK